MTQQITLSDGTTTINLPPDLEWQDEFGWTPVEHSTDYSQTGSLIVQEGERQDGRPITLFGGRDGAWMSRAELEQLYSLASVPSKQFTLNLWGRTFNVMFRRPPLTVEPIRRMANPGPDHQYAVTVNLMEINP
ncbi:hypothetical protein ACFQGA_09590 [Marinobacter koreensis]|uniref:Phage tail protein n=1 Tax=Marinobacter koreensis TaxID=335974 RepID=A0ABW0RHK1_9GAMM|nr:hypothetical protein [Marinobacter koreensis]MCK7547196.1 hypothetical protein [Marinobacter koreensis]